MSASETYLRVLTVEVSRLSDDKDEHWRQFREIEGLMTQVQEMQNAFFDLWRAWHFRNGSADKIRVFHEQWKRCLEEKRPKSDRPKLDVKPMQSDLAKEIYRFAVTNWPDVQTRVVTLTLNRLQQLVGSSKSAHGNWPAWHSWLLFRQQIPMFTSPCPLAIDKANCYLESPKDRDGSHVLHCTLSREDQAGKKTKKGIIFHALIWDRGKQMRSRRIVLERIAKGEVTFCGSQLFIKDRKLFIALAYKQEKPKRVAGEGTAFVAPMPNCPLRMRANGRTWRVGGDGRVIATVRRQLMAQRRSRQQTYRTAATSARKGHGHHRGLDKVTILSNRWRDFVKTYNRNMAVDICKRAVALGCGVVVLSKRNDDSRWLSKAGKFDRRDKSGWDWYGLEKILRDKAVEFGLEVQIHAKKEKQDPVAEVDIVAQV